MCGRERQGMHISSQVWNAINHLFYEVENRAYTYLLVRIYCIECKLDLFLTIFFIFVLSAKCFRMYMKTSQRVYRHTRQANHNIVHRVWIVHIVSCKMKCALGFAINLQIRMWLWHIFNTPRVHKLFPQSVFYVCWQFTLQPLVSNHLANSHLVCTFLCSKSRQRITFERDTFPFPCSKLLSKVERYLCAMLHYCCMPFCVRCNRNLHR